MEEIVGRESMERLDEERIDKDVILLMSDSELSQYIPVHGVRVKLRHFLKAQTKETQSESKKKKLLEVLRDKIEEKRRKKVRGKEGHSSSDEDDMRRNKGQPGNRHALKKDRRIEIGWIHKSTTGSVQVRSRKGGGTRKIRLPKDATKSKILAEGKRLFFPNAVSTKGPIDNFAFDVWDFKDRPLRDDITIGDMYDETKLPMLRFYMATIDTNDVEVQDPEPDSREIPTEDHDETVDLANTDTDQTGDLLFQAMNTAGIDMAEQSDGTDWDPPPSVIEPPPTATGSSTEKKGKVHLVRLHRGNVLKELIKAFKDIDPFLDEVTLEMVLPNGDVEAAEDNGGVTRDAICDFWTSFYDECTLGSKFKVPYLRHDFGEKEWVAVAKITAFGYRKFRYFPVLFSVAFIQQCMYDQVKSDLKDAFLAYIPESDSKTLKSAMLDIGSINTDELLDVLEQHEVKTIATQENIERLISEIAHKELIQTVMYVVDCWSGILKRLEIKEEALLDLYQELCPTPRRVLGRLRFPDTMSPDESSVANHLRRFIRELDNTFVARFLRFCTGSDLLICDRIEIAFVDVSGFARRPVAHTCTCLLELSKTYESFIQFRSEFLSVLNSNVWIMDII